MRTVPKLYRTTDYSLFEMHDLNRDFREKPTLLNSMKKYGFMPSSPLHVVPNGGRTLRIVRGHHRYVYAKRLKLPIYYVVDESNIDLFEMEAYSGRLWTTTDHCVAHSNRGDKDYRTVVEFAAAHGISESAAANLLRNWAAGSHNTATSIKDGSYKVAANQTFAVRVVRITDACHTLGLPFARSSSFLNAISLVCRVPQFKDDIFIDRLRTHHGRMMRRSSSIEYLDEIDKIYNYAAKSSRAPIAFEANALARLRRSTSGMTEIAKQRTKTSAKASAAKR